MLGVSQIDIERNYYMVDLPELLVRKRKNDAMQRLTDLRVLIASNNRMIEDAEYKTLVNEFTKAVGIKPRNTFDRNKFEQLRALTMMGANKAK